MGVSLKILPRAVDHGDDAVLILKTANIDTDTGILRLGTIGIDTGHIVEQITGVTGRAALDDLA